MCGIAGALTTSSLVDGRALVASIVESQVSRGPDAKVIAEYSKDAFRLTLGHNRLSIIDLRPEANQPMANGAGDLHVMLNGEIYNYVELRMELESAGFRFRTRSDTEVILEAYRAWGVDAFDRFIGMFAIAIYDERAGELLLVRDRFGVKPLYFWTDGRTLAFASTPTVIARWASLPPNLEYVSRGIRYRYYEDDTSISPYAGLAALEPSHYLRVQALDDRVTAVKQKYYDVHARVSIVREEIEGVSEDALERRLLELLRSACRLRLRSDVPLGLSVSGGVDSSAIAALVSESIDGSIGYSFSHPDDAESEGPLVAELAARVRMQPRYVCLSGGGDIVELFWKTLNAQDAPFPHPSIMAQYAVFRAARADHTIVLLGGQGGDEAFMGYRKFYLFYALSILRGYRISALPHFIASLLPFIPAVARRASVFLSERRRYARDGRGMHTRLALVEPKVPTHLGLRHGSTTVERQILDVTRFSLPSLLRYEDRNSMGNSVESRLPFLDQRVLEFGIALTERMKLRDGFGKWILRKTMAGRIPDSIRMNRDKRGFDVNQRQWIELGLGKALRDALLERRGVVANWLPSGAKLESLFSDELLAAHSQAFKEAVSLIWLADRT